MIIPSIDLMEGRAVQLEQGRKKVLDVESPVSLAEDFSRFGELAVIDLDAALGRGTNEETIKKICRVGDCRVGGGIRTVHAAEKMFSFGARRIIVGTQAFCEKGINRQFLGRLRTAVGRENIIVALDAEQGKVVTQGWRKRMQLDVLDVVQNLEEYAAEALFTCVEREGLMRGTDIEAVERLRSATGLRLTAAGGICSAGEIARLSRMEVNVQLGMALYSGKISIEKAFISSLKWKEGLLPTIVLDSSSQVLMLAYSSPESLKKMFSTAKLWLYSRSRSSLWMKGESSGNMMSFVGIRTDCDGDSLLVSVDPSGPACHTRRYSCFSDKRFSLKELESVIRERMKSCPSGSYTASLTREKAKEKILEEADELIAAEQHDDIIWEAADLFYFILAYLVKSGISLDSVLRELERRRRISSKEYLSEE
ncbi:MAG: phosphoribosyl-ATP diphosphatase [Candidatus Aminicenantes bacterium]|nr:phosphoribosyl-ATP diphosphatase [Candidatus Aminicenantes bacterium]